MVERANPPRSGAAAGIPLLAAVVLAVTVGGCSVYANLSFAVTDPAAYRFFPPFVPRVNANNSGHLLGAEYFQVAQALAAGNGFVNPFGRSTGPTAWVPPVLPVLLAGILRLCGGDDDAVMLVVIFLQVFVLIGTGLLVLSLAREGPGRAGTWAALALFLAFLLWDFHSWFQFTHDCWLVLLALDLLLAWSCCGRPLGRWRTAAGWGLFGGFCALVNPLVGLVWGVLCVSLGLGRRDWPRLAAALGAAGLALLPWTGRNYLVFGRLVPVKSNAAYELYQSQCLQPDGLLQRRTFRHFPGRAATPEGQEYTALGEMAFMDRKRDQFLRAVQADPTDYLDRVASRFLGATLWYEPFDREGGSARPGPLWLSRLIHPLPFLGLLLLVGTALRDRLSRAQWAAIGIYLCYLLPYIAMSYYERYGTPLLGVKVLLVFWAVGRLLRYLPGRRAEGRREAGARRVVPRPAAAAPLLHPARPA
jgi:hypothetical protein